MKRHDLMLIANRTDAVLLPDNNGWTNRLQIRSETSSRLYIVAQRTGGDRSWGCSCPGGCRTTRLQRARRNSVSFEEDAMKFKQGDRIRLVSMPNEIDPVPVGTQGTVHMDTTDFGTWSQTLVSWDDGRGLHLASPPDVAVLA